MVCATVQREEGAARRESLDEDILGRGVAGGFGRSDAARGDGRGVALQGLDR